MKRFLFIIYFISFVLVLNAHDFKDLDFSIQPKTSFFSQQKISENLKTGFVETKEKSFQNKKDVSLPNKTLLRSFERIPKTDAFGDFIPDSYLFYKQTLNTNQKSAYDEIYKAVMNANSKLTFLTCISKDEISNAIYAVYYDNPELFWWAGCFTWWYNSDGTVTSIDFDYLFNQSQLEKCNKAFLNMSLPIIFYANLLESDMDKIKYVHDYLCLSIDYDYDAVQAGKQGGKLQTAYSAVVEYKTVCTGYSKAFAYYMQQLGIPCVVLCSRDHAWNMVEVDGNFYQMDVTWNDDSKNRIPKYFNLLHSEMQKIQSHILSDISSRVIQQNPSKSDLYTYINYFGNIPIGSPYTYQEFQNIEEDIETPAYAKIYMEECL